MQCNLILLDKQNKKEFKKQNSNETFEAYLRRRYTTLYSKSPVLIKFRQAEKVGMATTFVTNHIRQTGSFFVRWLRKRHEKKYLNRSLRHLCMILCFIGGAVLSTVMCHYFKDRAIWGSLIFLIILQGDLLYADLVKEKELLDQVPNGH